MSPDRAGLAHVSESGTSPRQPSLGKLHTRGGRGAEWVSEAIRGLQEGALEAGAFRELWPELCSEDRTYDAAYAATPYLVEMAASSSLSEATEYLIVLGLITSYAGNVPADLEPGYRQAIDAALTLTLHALIDCPSGHELRYLLSAAAAFRNRTDLASALQNLDAIQEPCPACGHVVFPSELQRIVDAEQAGRSDGHRNNRYAAVREVMPMSGRRFIYFG